MKLEIPCHDAFLSAEIDSSRVRAVLTQKRIECGGRPPRQLVEDALRSPVGSPRLSELAEKADRVLLITSDHTRPLPSRITCAALLREIRLGNPGARIKILVATGCHRAMRKDELVYKFGPEIVSREEIVMHDASNDAETAFYGTLPSGGELWLNRLAGWAQLIVAEGFIEPHFFAGFSGGRKSILPGIASRRTVLYNHNAAFIADPRARAGVLAGNPIHRDMLFAARQAKLAFILNVVLDQNKRIAAAFAGDLAEAHERGCRFVLDHARVPAAVSDIVVTSNGGYPLDQNIYQAVKGMTGAEPCVREGGVIVMCAGISDGHGGESFLNWFRTAESADEVWNRIRDIPAEKTVPDQWQAQILARVLKKAKVILASPLCPPDLARSFHLIPAGSLEEALGIADRIRPAGSYTVIPDGVGVIPV